MSNTYEKHTTHTDALDTLGYILEKKEGRDAIHLAVECVQAGHTLRPGEHVYLGDSGKAYALPGNSDRGVGIVDPFIKGHVRENDWFWLVVYPRQISSLRHVWEHPAFPPSGETAYDGNGPELEPVSSVEHVLFDHNHPVNQIDPAKVEAERWLRDWIDSSDWSEYFQFEDVMEALETGSGGDYPSLSYRDGYLTMIGTDGYGNIPEAFWTNAEIYLGKKLQRTDWFSCSC